MCAFSLHAPLGTVGLGLGLDVAGKHAALQPELIAIGRSILQLILRVTTEHQLICTRGIVKGEFRAILQVSVVDFDLGFELWSFEVALWSWTSMAFAA